MNQKTKRKNYLEPSDLADELEKSQKAGNPTVKVCEMFRTIAQRLMGDSRFRHYPTDIKEELISESLLRCISNIKNYKPEYRDKCFSYFTRCCETSCFAYLKRHYRYLNIKRDLAIDFADDVESYSPEMAQRIRDTYARKDK